MEALLFEFVFPRLFVEWIMACVTYVSYQINLNGMRTRAFKAGRGLRQGDPMSPYLFVLVMEVLGRMLNTVKQMPNFNFHSRCERLNITHLCFASFFQG